MPDSISSDFERIQGTWRPVRIETLGYRADEDSGVRKLLIFEGDRVTTPGGSTCRFRLDPLKEPKELDLLEANTDSAQFHAIFTFEGNQLVICFNTCLSPRPRSFTTSKEVTDILTYYEREDG
jgi:uncharacterized protein (TIGR03067 family)